MRNYFFNPLLLLGPVLLGGLVTMPTASAEQVKMVVDNKTIFAKAAATELTHVYVAGDRIVNVRGVEGAYSLKKERTDGTIFIQPTPAFQQKSFTLFLSTEQGHTYPLLLTSVQVPAESIRLQPITPARKAAARWEQQSAYEQVLLALIMSLKNEKPPEGYALIRTPSAVMQQEGFTLQRLWQYHGRHLSGDVLRITNNTEKTITLDERQFYTAHTRAISLAQTSLSPLQQTTLYRVVHHDR